VRGLAVLLAREAALGSKVTASVDHNLSHLYAFVKGYVKIKKK
jgi:hypothetical protein